MQTITTVVACPQCGSDDIAQWDLVPERFTVTGADESGEPILDEYSGEIVSDGRAHDTYTCRACDFASVDFAPFVTVVQ